MSRSLLWMGHVAHARTTPKKHAFRYPVYFCSIDLDELPSLPQKIGPFSYNNINLQSIHDADYLRGEGSIQDKLLRELRGKPYVNVVSKVQLITCLRLFNYVFNPVSFYACRNANEELLCVVAEVNNTFGERHIYVLDEPTYEGKWILYRTPKQFHVSPFNAVDGEYRFRVPRDWTMNPLRIGVDLWHGDTISFTSEWVGRISRTLSTASIVEGIIKYPFAALLTMPRILWQAARLYYEKGLRIYMKPEPLSSQTFRVNKPSWRLRIAMNLVFSYFRRFQKGAMMMRLPDGTEHFFGDPHAEHAIIMNILNTKFFTRVLSNSDIGFGESYMAGEWDTQDVTGLLEWIVQNRDVADERDFKGAGLLKWINSIGHAIRHNSRENSRKNIRAHYDLSNEMYQQFLDPTMTYSSAFFAKAEDTLEEAQFNKLDRMIKLAQITKEDHVLEIGSGWGSFSMRAVEQTGCRVTTITLSEQQLVEAKARVAAAGLQDRIDVVYCDYRDMQGQFDKIVSIEMFEAVGHEYFGTFFAACDRLLKKDGILAMQVITIIDQRYEQYRRESDWIQKYIFPGGLCPSLTAFSAALTEHSKFTIETFENIGTHYGRTLRTWLSNFEQNSDQVKALGFDETFLRMWRYYLCYCEAGFNTRQLGTLQLQLTRPNNPTLPKCP